jgi:hypothetical protein
MLKIREAQMRVFEQAAAKEFEDHLLKYLNELFPKHCNVLGEAQVRRVIGYGLNKAKSHGLTDMRCLSLYVALMFMLGSNFDTDPQLPWAKEILGDETTTGEHDRIDRLRGKALDYADQVAGADNKHIDAAIERIRQEKGEAFSLGSSDFGTKMLTWLNQIYPEKCTYIGEEALRRMMLQGAGAAKSYGLVSERGRALYIALMFMLASGFDTDPQFPWAAASLNDPEVRDEGGKVARLYGRALAHLEKWVAYSKNGRV